MYSYDCIADRYFQRRVGIKSFLYTLDGDIHLRKVPKTGGWFIKVLQGLLGLYSFIRSGTFGSLQCKLYVIICYQYMLLLPWFQAFEELIITPLIFFYRRIQDMYMPTRNIRVVHSSVFQLVFHVV